MLFFLTPLWLSGSVPPLGRRDPAAWGGDHVGKPVPEFVSGDECLFCHRHDVGPSWGTNRHNRTIRDIDPANPALAALKNLSPERAAEVRLVLGGERRQRFLRPAEAFGKLEVLSVEWQPPAPGEPGRLLAAAHPHWNPSMFGNRCAGCHATGVDVNQRSFAARSLDCFVCHGDVSLEHSKNAALVHLSKKRGDAAEIVISICASCHVRTGRSRSTGLPYPNNFVAGDNLFRDFQLDFSDKALSVLNPADRHVLHNVRDVALFGKDEVTCLSCHEVHKQSSMKHHRVARGDICWSCHDPVGSMKTRKAYQVHSTTCGY
jgi:hypothetical protein